MVMEIHDSKTIRRIINKGTKVLDEPFRRSGLYDEEFDKKEVERLRLAGDLMIMSGKGTKKIRLSDLDRRKPVLPKGMSISTEKGTSTRKL